MKKADDLKESKVSRHEVAKQKFKYFERSMSCKSLNTKGDFIPGPGQFAIVSNHQKRKTQTGNQLPNINPSNKQVDNLQKDLKFTTNLKLITRQRSPSRVSQLLNETVNKKIQQRRSLKKIIKSQSTGNLRPMTSVSTQLVTQLQGKNNLNESKVIVNAANYDKKYYLKKQFNQGNTFMIKSRSVIPKHAYGHKSIRLGPQDNQRRLKIDNKAEQNQKQRKFTKIKIDEETQSRQRIEQLKANFLPIQYYMIDDQKPQKLIQKYKIQQNVLVGYSKWQDLNGQFEWKKCRIIQYIKDKQRWQIQWLHNGKRKIVGRNNLFFQKQNFDNFQKIIHQAQQFRKRSQIFMRYNWLIDNMNSQTHILENQQVQRIIKMAVFKLPKLQKSQGISSRVQLYRNTEQNNPNIENLNHFLLDQIKQKYIRANHIVQFNAALPFNEKYKQQFRGYLPEQYFYPNKSANKLNLQKRLRQRQSSKNITSQKTALQQSTAVKPTEQMRKFFQQGTKNFKSATSLSSVHRIQIIQFLNKSQYNIKSQRIANHDLDLNRQWQIFPKNELRFFSFFINKTNHLSDVSSKLENTLFQSVAKLNNIVCDIEYFIAKQLDPIYMDRKGYGYQQFEHTIKNYRKFLHGVNMRVQNIGRDILYGMMEQLNSLIQFDGSLTQKSNDMSFIDKVINQKNRQSVLKLKIKLQVKGQTIQCSPKKSQITQTLSAYIQKVIKQFGSISCIRKSYIEQLRPKDKMKIIQTLQYSNTQEISSNRSQYSYNQSENVQEWKISQQLIQQKQKIMRSIEICGQVYEMFHNEIKTLFQSILSLQSDIKRKSSKKYAFSQIQDYLTSTNKLKQKINKLKFISLNMSLDFKNNCDQTSKNQSEQNSLKSITLTQSNNSNDKKMILDFARTLKLNSQPKYIKIGMYCFNIQDFIYKAESRLEQISHDLYKLIMQKISKQNQKLQKNIDLIIERLENQPNNIKQMISLQQYINQQATEELFKISSRIRQLHQKFSMLQKLNIQIEYKDFYQCHKIYMKPIKIKTTMNQRLRSIQSQYKKRFGESLTKQTSDLLNQIKQIQEKFYASIQINSIQEMDSSFLVFSKLKQRIQNSQSKSILVNQYESAMKWINTNFQRLIQIKDEFLPYYQLISLQKNFKFHIQIQLTQNLHTIDANRIFQDVITGCDELSNLQTNVFYNNAKILQIVKQIGQEYKTFRDKLPLLQILRNADLRQRHWISIKNLTGFDDILSEKITFDDLERRDIKKYQKKLIQISHIATRQLIYEKRLNKMKKEWKEMKIQMTKVSQYYDQNGNINQIKVISNLDEIQLKTQNDIYQIQQILSSSFIKFLQKDILNWRNYTLYKMYEFIEIWKNIEHQILQMHQMFSKRTMKNQASNQYIKFKSLQKNWRNITNQIQQQPNLLQLLQTKINDSLKYTVQLIQELKKSVNQFFQKKKQRFSRFGSLSQQQLIALFSNNDQKQIFDQAVRKCLHGVKNVIRNQVKKITCVKTHLDQQIHFNQGIDSSGMGDDNSPDRIIEDIQKRIKRSLRNSIDDINGQKTNKILQIILFHQRIIFTRQIQLQLSSESKNGLDEGYINALLVLKSKIIQALFKQYETKTQENKLQAKTSRQTSKKQQNLIKIQSQLNQLINHLDIAQSLFSKNTTNIYDFQWLTQIRTYQKQNSYFIEIGLNKLEYGFEITDQPQFIVQQSTLRIFLNISMAIKQKMFSILSGNMGSGKLASLHYLANIHGRNQNVLNCHKAISYENIFDFFRMAANGIWVIFNTINLLSVEVFSCFRQSSQLFWANYPTLKNKSYFILGDKNITFNTHQIGLFGTINLSKNNSQQCNQIDKKISSYYRNFNMSGLDIRYVLQCKLILAGFEYCSNTKKFMKMIQTIENQSQKYYQTKKSQGYQIYKSLTFSKLLFLQKVIYFAKQFKQIYKGYNVDDYLLLELALHRGIQEITKNLQNLKSQILEKLKSYFNFIVRTPNITAGNMSQQSNNSKQLRTTNTQVQKQQQIKLNQKDELIKRDIKKLFLDKKLYSNRKIVNSYFQILQTLKQKHSIIVLGPCSSGKSTLIQLLSDNKIQRQLSELIMMKGQKNITAQSSRSVYIDDFKINLNHIHPNAYSLKQLYGDINSNGIVNCIIKKSYQALQKPKNQVQQPKDESQPLNSLPSAVINNIGIVFDSEISHWIQPLLPLIKYSSTYIQPNGKNMIIEHPIKLIFECRDLAHVSPAIILSTNIVQVENNLKWQNIFSNYLKKNFKPCYQKKVFIDFCEVMVTFILEPVLQFFKTSIVNHKNSNAGQAYFISEIYQSYLKNQTNYIPLIFNLFIALIQNYFMTHCNKQVKSDKQPSSIQRNVPEFTRKGSQSQSSSTLQIFSNNLDDKEKSSILNIFLMSITWTIGNLIPEQSKKTFSRHFKYLVKRAIQLNIKNIQKDTLPKDDQDIFEICFVDYKWCPWEEVPLILNQKNKLANKSEKYIPTQITLKHKIKYLYLLEKYCQAQQPFYVLGKSSTGKNSLMLEFLNTKSNQVYNKILVACTPNSSHLNAKKQIKRQIEKQKYSHAFKGFVHGKITLFYLCDMNLPLLKNDTSLNQFIHKYIRRKGWYLQPTDQFFEFKNINFCGTLNSTVKFSQNLLKYLNPLLYVQKQSQIKDKIYSILSSNELLSPFKQNLIKLMTNLQQVIIRQLKNKLKIQFTLKDTYDIALILNQKITGTLFEGISSAHDMTSSLKIDDYSNQKKKRSKILQLWICQTQKKYLQKFGNNYDKQKIFYFINNVLMQQQRIRYKALISSDKVFISNISYYLNKLNTKSESKQTKKHITKMFMSQNSYKIYENLDSLKQDLNNLHNNFQQSGNSALQVEQSYGNEVQNMIKNSKDQESVTNYLKCSLCLLDYFGQQNNYLTFIINDMSEDEGMNKQQEVQLSTQCTIRQIFKNKSIRMKNNKLNNKNQIQIQKLLNYVSKINNTQILEYKRKKTQSQPHLDWRIFINQLFQLINSPSASNLHQHYIVHLANINANQFFILQDLITLKRTGTLQILEQFLNSQEIDLDENIEKDKQNKFREQSQSQSNMGSDKSISNSQFQSNQELHSQRARRKLLMQKKREMNSLIRKNITQSIRQKILKKIKFILTFDCKKFDQLKPNYQMLLEKSHILWSSHIFSQQSINTPISKQNAMKSLNKNQDQHSLKRIQSSQYESVKKIQQFHNNNRASVDESSKSLDYSNNIKKQYNNHKQTFNHFISYKQVKALYLQLQQNLPSQTIKTITMQIQQQSNLQFLSFMDLIQDIKNGIQNKTNQQILFISKQYEYFQNLSQSFHKQLFKFIIRRKNILQKKEIQLKSINQNLQKANEQNQKFKNYFTKSEQAIALLQKQSKQANQVYYNYVGKQMKMYSQAQNDLVQVLKTAKDKKIVLTNQMKGFLDLLGTLINKKLKPQQNMTKQIVKDISALKIHKKILNLYIELPLNQKANQKAFCINEKSVAKLKQFIQKNLSNQFNIATQQLIKKMQQPNTQKIKQGSSLSQSLIISLKQYFISLLIYYNKCQEQGIKILNKKCNKCVKELTKTKQQYQKSQKSKQYQNVCKQLQNLRKQKDNLLNSYNYLKKEYQKLKSLQKKCNQIFSLNMQGSYDQKQLLSRELMDSESSSLDKQQQKSPNLVIQKIKSYYLKQKNQIVAINNTKDIISILIALKLSCSNSNLDTSILYKNLSKQSFQAIKSINIQLWQKLFKQEIEQDKANEENQVNKLQKPQGIQYFLKHFSNIASFKLISGLIILQRNDLLNKWVSQNKKNVFKGDSNLYTRLNQAIQKAEYARKLNLNNQFQEQTMFIIQIGSTLQLTLVKNQLEDQKNIYIRQYLNRKSIVLIIDDGLIINSLPSTRFSQHFNINILKLNDQQSRFLVQMQQNLQQDLSQQRKQSDIKLIMRYNQLNLSQKYIQQKRKNIINDYNNIIVKQNSFVSLFQENQITQLANQYKLNQKLNYLQRLQQHLNSLRQNLDQYIPVTSTLEALPNVVNLKKKSSVHASKLIKYIIKIYQGLLILQQQNIISFSHKRGQIFLKFVQSIISRQKQLMKNQSGHIKLFKNIKNKLWQHYLIFNNDKKIQIGLVFAISGEQSLSQKENSKLLKLIIRFYNYSRRIIETDRKILMQITNNYNKNNQKSQQFNSKQYLIQNFVLKHLSSTKKAQSEKQIILSLKQQKEKSNPKQKNYSITQQFQSILQLLAESFTCFYDLKSNFLKKIETWIDLLKNIDTKFGQNIVNTLPEPYNDINRSFFGLFVALVNPQKLISWINLHLNQEDLIRTNQFKQLSNQSLILQVKKFNYKQTVLISDNGINKLYDLSSRIKKQIKLYSKLEVQKSNKLNYSQQQTSLKSSPLTTKKDIQINQLSYFNNRKFEQQFIDQLYQCMKNSSWLVIDVQNFKILNQASNSQEIDTNKLQSIIKLINLYTSLSKTNQDQQENSQHSYNKLAQQSQKNFSIQPKINKNQFTALNFDNCQFQIFFLFPKSMKSEAYSYSFLQNQKRCYIQLNQFNQIQRCLTINKTFHQQLTTTKKSIKDYDQLNMQVKQILYYILQNNKQIWIKLFDYMCKNQQYFMNVTEEVMLRKRYVFQAVDRLNKLAFTVFLQPELLRQLIISQKKVKKLKTPQTQQNQIQQQTNPQIAKKQSNQAKPANNSRFYRQKQSIKRQSKTSKTSSTKLKSPSDQSQKQIQSQISSKKTINKDKQKVQAQTQIKQKTNKNVRIIGVIKLIQSYLQSTFSQSFRKLAGLQDICSDKLYQNLLSNCTQTKKSQLIKIRQQRLQQIMIGENKMFNTSNKSILQNLLNFMKQQPKQNQSQKQKYKLTFNQQNASQGFSLNKLSQLKYNHVKLFLERLYFKYRHFIVSENFTEKISKLNQIKKKCEIQQNQLKKQIFKDQPKQFITQNSQSNQFNFSSLTQNLTIQQMRKKLTLTKKNTLGGQTGNQSMQIKKISASQKIKLFIYHKKQLFISIIQQRILILKSFKSIFLLQKINYQTLQQTWKKFSHIKNQYQLQKQLIKINKNQQQEEYRHLSLSLNALKNFQNFNTSSGSYYNASNRSLQSQKKFSSPIFSLQYFSATQLTQLIQLLKQGFGETNRHKPPNIKTHFVLQQQSDSKSLIKDRQKQITLYKVCQFTAFYLYNLNRVENILSKNKIIMKVDQQIGFCKGADSIKLSLYFEQQDDESDFESSQAQSQEQEQEFINKRHAYVPFYLNKLRTIEQQDKYTMNTGGLNYVQVKISLEKTVKSKQIGQTNAFIYY